MTDMPDVDWNRLRQARMKKIIQFMRKRDLDAIIVTTLDNIRYFADWRPVPMLTELYNDEFGLVFTVDGDCYIYQPTVIDAIKKPSEEMPWVKELLPMPSWSPNPFVAKIWSKIYKKKLAEIKAKRIGVEYLPFQNYEELKKAMPNAHFQSVFNEVLKMRAVKLPDEIKLLEYNAAVLDECIKESFKVIKKGVTEYKLASTIAEKMWNAGTEYMSHNLILSCRRTTIEWFPKERTVEEGDTVLADVGFFGLGGYVTDITRTVTAGKPSNEILEAYTAVKEAHFRGIKSLTPGTKCSEVDAAIRKVLLDCGYPETPYSNGHGIGLRCVEAPHIYKPEWMAEDMKIEPGMIICLEPETYIHGSSIKIEDMVRVTDTGPKLLTKYDYMV